jgi:hypothetical protein
MFDQSLKHRRTNCERKRRNKYLDFNPKKKMDFELATTTCARSDMVNRCNASTCQDVAQLDLSQDISVADVTVPAKPKL